MMHGWLNPRLWNRRFGGLTVGLEHPRILIYEVDSGTNPLGILKDRLHFILLAAVPTS